MVINIEKYVHIVHIACATHWHTLWFINGNKDEEMCKYIHQSKKMSVYWGTEMKRRSKGIRETHNYPYCE